ncbi:deleted in malignant brain tumors 1 protein-like isoform X2 [Mya arenaria]|uniref:deleted in malignant brain tumors 1 protein-like isoform X2 n=1 Tax=Mya arenaria TaxID=6604 RepID=UPI0022E342A9|nr:deleted in malignant brain tumors 1 protein-like isoform X2 [Mya arenaria]
MKLFASVILVFLLDFSPSYGETKVRLAGGESRSEGKLQVEIRGEWLTVCSNNNYDKQGTAQVVCQMLNASANAYNGTTTLINSPYLTEGISMGDLHCDGSEEDLLFCKSGPWRAHSCPLYTNALWIECNTPVYNTTIADYALGGNGSYEGLCDSGFGPVEAQIYCRTANLPAWNAFIHHHQYVGHSLQIYANCIGYETDISQCNLYQADCHYTAGVDCSVTDIGLMGGHNNLTGTVFVNVTDSWRYICADDFGPNEARVVCKTLNGTDVPGQISREYVGHYGLVSDLQCTGSEDDVSLCTSNVLGYCSSGYAAAVDCNTVRLVGGTNYTNGRVEVYDTFNQTWENVCYDHFSYNDAKVICRQLEFYIGALRYRLYRYFTRPTIYRMNCHGYEDDLSQCAIDWNNGHCSYDAEVDCSVQDRPIAYPTTSNSAQVRLVDGDHNHSGRVEVYYQNQWGTVCRQNFDHNDLMVVCRTLGYYRGYGYGKIYEGVPASGGNVVIEDLQCRGSESNVKLCTSKVWLSNTCDHSQDVSIDCNSYGDSITTVPYGSIYYHTGSPVDGDIRLVGFGYGSASGRLEVFYNGQWGTVCSRSFDIRDAETVCYILGYYGSPTYYRSYYIEGPSYGAIMIEDLNCRGGEWSLAQCDSGAWLSNKYCSHNDDVGVDCSGQISAMTTESTSTWSPYTTPNKSYCGGYFNGWSGYIASPNYPKQYFNGQHCEYHLSVPSGHVVCLYIENMSLETCCDHLQLYDGPSSSYNLISSVTSTSAPGINWNDTEICSTGPTMTAVFTTDGSVTMTGFNATYSAFIPNSNGIRLVNGHSPYSGRVEVYHNGQWGTVCDDSFDALEAQVVCRMIGSYRGDRYVMAYSSAHYGQGSGQIWLDDLNCHGYESNIYGCKTRAWGEHNCGHGEDAGVDCDYNYYDTTTPWWIATTDPSTSIRLVNGHTSYSGRVEVYHNGRWGTVCDDNFDHRDVMVICRMLGYYMGQQYGRPYQGAYFGSGSGTIWLDNLNCGGYESDVQYCSRNSWGDHNCDHSEDAGVDCHAYFYETTTYYPTMTNRTTYPWWLHTSAYTTYQPWWMTTSGYTVYDAIRVSCNEQGWDIQVDMGRLRLAAPGALASDIYLGENSCTGTEEWGILHFRQGLRQCLTSETQRYNVLVYTNELVYAEHDPVYSFIIRNYNWTVGVECDVQRNETSSGHIHHDNNQHTVVPVTGASHYGVNMTFYRDANFRMPLPGNPLHVPVGTDVYVKVFTTTSDWTVKMRVHSCFTRPANSASNNLEYFLIKNGCEMDSNTHLISQSAHETRFVFKDFEYTSSHEGIDVECDTTFCSSHDYSRQCTQTCNPVIRRSGHVHIHNATTDSDYDVTTDGHVSIVNDVTVDSHVSPVNDVTADINASPVNDVTTDSHVSLVNDVTNEISVKLVSNVITDTGESHVSSMNDFTTDGHVSPVNDVLMTPPTESSGED